MKCSVVIKAGCPRVIFCLIRLERMGFDSLLRSSEVEGIGSPAYGCGHLSLAM